MKLIIQIPCLNEEKTLPATVADLPRVVEGFDAVEFLVVDDGSTDATAAVARAIGVTHVIRLNGNQGLARAFMAGLIAAVDLGADVVVNTDADNQYQAGGIAQLVEPLIAGRADITIGARPIATIRHFSPSKRLLQRVGSRAVRVISGADVLDASSGFRAFTRDAAIRLNVFNRFSYTIETTIQAGLGNMRIVSVPVEINGPTRPSRLFKSNLAYVCRGAWTMFNVYTIYRPTHVFALLSALLAVPGSVLGVRYVTLSLLGEGRGHIQSVIACAALLAGGLFMVAVGILANLLGVNRRLLEEIRSEGQYRSLRGRRRAHAETHTRKKQRDQSPVIPSELRTAHKHTPN